MKTEDEVRRFLQSEQALTTEEDVRALLRGGSPAASRPPRHPHASFARLVAQGLGGAAQGALNVAAGGAELLRTVGGGVQKLAEMQGQPEGQRDPVQEAAGRFAERRRRESRLVDTALPVEGVGDAVARGVGRVAFEGASFAVPGAGVAKAPGIAQLPRAARYATALAADVPIDMAIGAGSPEGSTAGALAQLTDSEWLKQVAQDPGRRAAFEALTGMSAAVALAGVFKTSAAAVRRARQAMDVTPDLQAGLREGVGEAAEELGVEARALREPYTDPDPLSAKAAALRRARGLTEQQRIEQGLARQQAEEEAQRRALELQAAPAPDVRRIEGTPRDSRIISATPRSEPARSLAIPSVVGGRGQQKARAPLATEEDVRAFLAEQQAPRGRQRPVHEVGAWVDSVRRRGEPPPERGADLPDTPLPSLPDQPEPEAPRGAVSPDPVRSAAVRVGGVVTDGKDHSDAAYRAWRRGVMGDREYQAYLDDPLGTLAEDGFVTSSGRFLGRSEAYEHARAQKQPLSETDVAVPGELSAEDLPSPRPTVDVQPDIFGGRPKVTGDLQGSLLAPDAPTLAGAERQARDTVARLSRYVETGKATPGELQQYQEALALLRRGEAQSAEEVALRARQQEAPTPDDSGELFGNETKERVTMAAFRVPTGQVFTGADHGEIVRKLERADLSVYDEGVSRGFVTDRGRFVTVDEAAALAGVQRVRAVSENIVNQTPAKPSRSRKLDPRAKYNRAVAQAMREEAEIAGAGSGQRRKVDYADHDLAIGSISTGAGVFAKGRRTQALGRAKTAKEALGADTPDPDVAILEALEEDPLNLPSRLADEFAQLRRLADDDLLRRAEEAEDAAYRSQDDLAAVTRRAMLAGEAKRRGLLAARPGRVDPRVAGVLARAGIGAAAGAAVDDENRGRGAVVGAGLASAGPAAIRAAIRGKAQPGFARVRRAGGGEGWRERKVKAWETLQQLQEGTRVRWQGGEWLVQARRDIQGGPGFGSSVSPGRTEIVLAPIDGGEAVTRSFRGMQTPDDLEIVGPAGIGSTQLVAQAGGAVAGATTGAALDEDNRVRGAFVGATAGVVGARALVRGMRPTLGRGAASADETRVLASMASRGRRPLLARVSALPQSVKGAARNVYTKIVDETQPLRDFGRNMGAGDKLSHVVSQAKGWRGGAQARLDTLFRDVVQAAKGNENAVTALAAAERALELARHGMADKGVDLAAAQRVVAGASPETKKAARLLHGYYRSLLDYKLANGVLTQDAYDAIITSGDYYIPFVRDFGDETKIPGAGGGKFTNRGTGVRRMTDEQASAPIVDPFEQAVLDTFEAHRTVAKQRVTNLVSELVQADPAAAQALGIRQLGHGETAKLGREVAANVQGSRARYEVRDAELFDAWAAFDNRTQGIIVKVLAPFKRTLQTTVTLMPDFAIRNMLRDNAQSAIQYGLPARSVAGGAAAGAAAGAATDDENRLRGAARGAAFGASAGVFGPQALRVGAAMGDIVGKKAIFQEWLREGGSGMSEFYARPDQAAKLVRQLRGDRNLLDSVMLPIDGLQSFGRIIEQAPRLARYKALRKAGKAVPESIHGSRDISLDFSNIGSDTKGIAAVTAFFNAKVQGWDKLVRMLKNPKTWAMGAATLTAPTIALWSVNKDDEEYWARPQWERNMFWLVPNPAGGFFRIPKPFEVGFIFASLPERVLDYAYRRDPETLQFALKDMISTTTEGTFPIPTGIEPLLENAVNFDFFTNRPVVSPGLERLPDELQYDQRTSALSRLAAKVPGLPDSPQKTENILRGYTGNAGREVLNITDRIARGSGLDRRPRQPEQPAPLVGSFTTRDDAVSDQETAVRRRFAEAEKAHNGALKLFERGDPGAQSFVDRNRELLVAYEELKEQKAVIDLAAEARREIALADIDPAEKREMIVRLNRRVGELLRKDVAHAHQAGQR